MDPFGKPALSAAEGAQGKLHRRMWLSYGSVNLGTGPLLEAQADNRPMTHMDGLESSRGWEHFPHEADMGIRGFGITKPQAFEQAALALTAVVTDPQQVDPQLEHHFTCDAPDDELLLVDWLNALIYEMACGHMVFGRFDVTITDHHLKAIARGEPVDRIKHEPAVEIKGATYTELSVRQIEGNGWVAQCVVDV